MEVFPSMTKAAEKYNVTPETIRTACKDHIKGATSAGLQWDYYIEDYIKKHTYHNQRQVICLTTGEVYNSIKEAERTLGINNISMVCNGKTRQAGGYHWRYI